MKTEESKNGAIPLHTRLSGKLKSFFTLENLKSIFSPQKVKSFFNFKELIHKIKENKIAAVVISVLVLLIISLLIFVKPGSINRHINALGSGDIEKAKKAETELVKAGKRAVGPLMDAVKNSKPAVGLAAVKILAEIEDPRVDEFLREVVSNPKRDIDVRAAAAKTLAEEGGTQSIEFLVSVLTKEKDEAMAGKIGDILCGAGELSVNPLISAMKEYDVSENSPAGILIRIGESSVEPLIKVLSDGSTEAKKCAIFALGKIGDRRAIDPLIKSLQDNKDSGIRDVSFEALSVFGKEYISELFPLLKIEDEDIKVRAIKLFADLGNSEAIKPLFNVILEKDTHLHEEIFEAFSRLGDAGIGALIASFKIPDKDVKVGAAKKLIEIGEPAVNSLIFALKEEDYSIRWLSAATLCKLSHLPLVKRLVSEIDDDISEEDIEMASWAYPFYILMGVPGSDEIMVKALEKYGDEVMAEDFMNCGNKILADAAYKWAEDNGFEVEQKESTVGTLKWGSAQES